MAQTYTDINKQLAKRIVELENILKVVANNESELNTELAKVKKEIAQLKPLADFTRSLYQIANTPIVNILGKVRKQALKILKNADENDQLDQLIKDSATGFYFMPEPATAVDWDKSTLAKQILGSASTQPYKNHNAFGYNHPANAQWDK